MNSISAACWQELREQCPAILTEYSEEYTFDGQEVVARLDEHQAPPDLADAADEDEPDEAVSHQPSAVRAHDEESSSPPCGPGVATPADRVPALDVPGEG